MDILLKPTYEELEKKIVELENTISSSKEVKAYVDVFNDAPFHIWAFNGENCSFINKTYLDYIGLSESDYLSSAIWTDYVHPDDLVEVSKIWQDAFERKIEYDNYFRLRNKDGVYKDFWCRAQPVFNDKGVFVYFLAYNIDITEQQKEWKVLAESELRLKFAIEGNADGLWDWNLITNEVYFSAQWKKMLGYADDEISGSFQEWDKLVHPDDKKKVYEEINKHINGEIDFYEKEYRVLCKDNTYKWILDRGKIISFTSDNKPERMIGTHSDISLRKKIEQALKASEAKFKDFVSHSPDIIYKYSSKRGGLFWSDRVFDILGIKPDEIKNDPFLWNNLIHPEDKPKVDDAIINYAKGDDYKIEYRIKAKNGNWVWLQDYFMHKTIIGDDAIIEGHATDITDRKIAEQALKESEEKLKIANQTKDKFFSIIAHDLRSPFNSIIGFSDLLLKRHAKYDSQKRERLIEPIVNSAKETLKLLDNLLDWSRTQTGKIGFSPKAYSLFDLFDQIMRQTEYNAKQKGISLINQLNDDITIFADEYMLSTILRNLISNAIKFTNRNGKIELLANKNNENIIISVKDNGIGIEQQKQKKIFDIGEKTSTDGTEKERGTGLGLILCKEFVEKHNGKIWIESQIEIGTSFFFSIPIQAN